MWIIFEISTVKSTGNSESKTLLKTYDISNTREELILNDLKRNKFIQNFNMLETYMPRISGGKVFRTNRVENKFLENKRKHKKA